MVSGVAESPASSDNGEMTRKPISSTTRPVTLRGELHAVLMDQLAQAPRQLLAGVLEKKLRDADVEPPPGLVDAMVEHAMSGTQDAFHWDDAGGAQKNIHLTFTDDDTAKLETAFKALLDGLPALIEGLLESISKSTLREVKSDWAEHAIVETTYYQDFKAGIEERWGSAFRPLRMQLALSHEIGGEIAVRNSRSKSTRQLHLRSVLSRLHARSCQIVSEILALLEGGFADGAMARWRTLYEISVVATVIAEGGDATAKRYLEHDAVESKFALNEYERCHAALGFRPVSKRDRKAVEAAFAAAVARHGAEFGKPYGWAATDLRMKRVTFREIEDKAQRSPMRSYYKMASYNVHADVKGITHRLGVPNNSPMLLAGASNVGLSEPGQNAAITLAQMTGLLMGDKHSRLEPVLHMRMLMLLRDEAVAAFVRCERAIERDERILKPQRGRKSRCNP